MEEGGVHAVEDQSRDNVRLCGMLEATGEKQDPLENEIQPAAVYSR